MATTPRLPDSLKRLPIAHRALHDITQGRPENSRAAIRAAMAAGYGIELDLQLSQDGQAMVFHDDTLERLTPHDGPVSARTAGALTGLRLRGGDEGIPTLREILGLVGGAVPLLIELKDQTGAMSPTDGRLEQAVARDLAAYGGDVALMSFNPHCMARMAQLLPQVPRGLTTSAFQIAAWKPLSADTCKSLRKIADFAQVGASFISHEWRYLDMPRVGELAAQGADILCWTVKSPRAEAMARALACNVTFEGYLSVPPA